MESGTPFLYPSTCSRLAPSLLRDDEDNTGTNPSLPTATYSLDQRYKRKEDCHHQGIDSPFYSGIDSGVMRGAGAPDVGS